MAEYDLSKKIISYLDRHLAFPLLAHLAETNIFAVSDVQVAEYELAKGTNMFDYAQSLFVQLHPDAEVPAGVYLLLCFYPPAQQWPQSSMRNGKTQYRLMKDYNKKPRPCSMSLKTPMSPRLCDKIKTRICSI